MGTFQGHSGLDKCNSESLEHNRSLGIVVLGRVHKFIPDDPMALANEILFS